MTSTIEPETPHDERGAKRGSPARRVLRVLLLVVATIATVWTLVSQFLALVPVVWTLPLLQWVPLQSVIVLIDTYRDALGVWNVVIAGAAVVIFILLRSPRRGWAWTRITASAVGAIGAVTSTAMLFTAIAPTGVSMFGVGDPFESYVTTPNETVTFGTAGDVTMQGDLYLPEEIAPSDGWPVVVSVHGGGFVTGTRQPSLFTKNLPQNGYAVLDIDWRPATATFHAWDTQVGDVGCALGWVNAEGMKHEVDVNRLSILGMSSGGNLAINSAYMANSGTLTSTCDADAIIPDVKAVIGGYPAVNLTGLQDTSALSRQVVQDYIGGTSTEYPERYEYVDSAPHISNASPPTFVYTGTRDHLVLASTTIPFIDALNRNGVVNKFVEYPGVGHGAGEQAGTNYATAATLKSTVEWLDTHDK